MIYQFVKSIQSTYFINHKLTNKGDIDYHRINIKRVYDKLMENGFSISQILGKNITVNFDKTLLGMDENPGLKNPLMQS